jgi:hypothetical protein
MSGSCLGIIVERKSAAPVVVSNMQTYAAFNTYVANLINGPVTLSYLNDEIGQTVAICDEETFEVAIESTHNGYLRVTAEEGANVAVASDANMCQICLASTDKIDLQCTHTFCRACLANYVRNVIENNMLTGGTVDCPFTICSASIG